MYIVNAAPQHILLGVQDLSTRQLPVVEESFPTHLPFVPLFTQKGDPAKSSITVGLAAETIYGSETFNYRGPYATHQTVLYKEALAPHANKAVIKRVLAPNAKKATMRLAHERVRSENPVYKRTPDGDFLYENGAKVPDGNYLISGHRARWVLLPIPEEGVGQFGRGQTSVGTLRPHPSQGSDSINSSVVPIMDLEVEFGAYGENIGMSLYSPHPDSEDAIDANLVEELGKRLFRMKLFERADAKSSPVTQTTQDGARYVDFSFSQDAYSEIIKQSVAFNDVYGKYVIPEEGGTPEISAPFKRVAVYEENIATVLSELNAYENDNLGTDLPDEMFDFIGNFDMQGKPYHSVELLGPLDGGIRLDQDTVHYAMGGSDGDMTPENYEQAVRDLMNGFENDEELFMDEAYWPISCVWDSGFSNDTKEVLPRPMGLRKDILCILATQDANQALNTASIDSSIGLSLRNRLLLLPESTYYGTSCTRGAVYAGSFTLEDSEWTKPVPLTVDIAKKVANRMGASNGKWKANSSFATAPNNVVELAKRKRYNAPYRPLTVRNKDWRNGIGYAQTFGRNSVFIPAFPTVYPNKTSILADLEVAFCVAELEKVCQRTWRAMTNSKLSPTDFIAKSNRTILAYVRDKFDGEFEIRPETYFDGFDEASGYSWKCRINLYAETSKYVGVFTIAARRMEDLVNG